MADLQLPNTVEEEGTETGRICESKDRHGRVARQLSPTVKERGRVVGL